MLLLLFPYFLQSKAHRINFLSTDGLNDSIVCCPDGCLPFETTLVIKDSGICSIEKPPYRYLFKLTTSEHTNVCLRAGVPDCQVIAKRFNTDQIGLISQMKRLAILILVVSSPLLLIVLPQIRAAIRRGRLTRV